jgi:hypothetical protein
MGGREIKHIQKALVLKHAPVGKAALYNQQHIVYNFNRHY